METLYGEDRELPYYYYRGDALKHELLTQIADLLRPMNHNGNYWTISYGDCQRIIGLRTFSTPLLWKLLDIIKAGGGEHKEMGGYSTFRANAFIPEICAGKYKTASQSKTLIHSLHHFMYLTDEYPAINVWILSMMIRGLPHCRERILSSTTPARKKTSEALLRFMARSLQAQNETGQAAVGTGRGQVAITIKPSLCDLLVENIDDAEKIGDMYLDEGIDDEELIRERLKHHGAISLGAL